MLVEVKGQTWDVVRVEGDTAILASGQEIECSPKTIATVKSQLEGQLKDRRKWSARKPRS